MTLYKALKERELGNRQALAQWLKQKAVSNLINDKYARKVITVADAIRLFAREDNLLAVIDAKSLSLYDLNTQQLWIMQLPIQNEYRPPYHLVVDDQGLVLYLSYAEQGSVVRIVINGEQIGHFLLAIKAYCCESLRIVNQRIFGFHHTGLFNEWSKEGELIHTVYLDRSFCINLNIASNQYYYVAANGLRGETNALCVFSYNLSTNSHNVLQLENPNQGTYQKIDAICLLEHELIIATQRFRFFEGWCGWQSKQVHAQLAVIDLEEGKVARTLTLPSGLAVQQITANEDLIVAYGVTHPAKEQVYVLHRDTDVLQEISLSTHDNRYDFEESHVELHLKETCLTICYAKQRGAEAIHRVVIDLSQNKPINRIRYPLMSHYSFFNGTLLLGQEKKLYLEDFKQLLTDDEGADIRMV